MNLDNSNNICASNKGAFEAVVTAMNNNSDSVDLCVIGCAVLGIMASCGKKKRNK